MAVFNDFDIEWGGVTYTVSPSMRLLRAIEGQDISLMNVVYQSQSGKPQASIMATVVGIVLRSAGAKVSDDDLCAEFMVGSNKAVWQLWNDVLEAISPTAPAEKKPAAPEKKPQSKKAK